MSLLLPQDYELRSMFDIKDLAERRWTTLPRAKASARLTFERARKGSIRSAQFLVIRADDNIELISIGPRGGVKTLWKFGKPYGGA